MTWSAPVAKQAIADRSLELSLVELTYAMCTGSAAQQNRAANSPCAEVHALPSCKADVLD